MSQFLNEEITAEAELIELELAMVTSFKKQVQNDPAKLKAADKREARLKLELQNLDNAQPKNLI